MKSMPGLARRNSWTALAIPTAAVLTALCVSTFDRSRAGRWTKPAASPESRRRARGARRRARRCSSIARRSERSHAADGTYIIGGSAGGDAADSHAPHRLSPRVRNRRGYAPASAPTQDFTLRQDPLQLQAIVVTGTPAPTVESQVERRRHDADARKRSSSRAAAQHDRDAALRPGLHPRRELGRRGEREHQHARHSRRRVRDVHGGRAAGVSHHAHVLHERRQSLPPRREHRAHGGRARRQLGALRIEHAGRDHQLHQQDRRRSARRARMVATGATQGLARYDVNVNGPIGDDWRFNVGGFYRYDHGVRDPGFPGIRGGQFKGNVTRLLDNGYVRFSAKVIDDRNQFILDLPFENADDPHFVPGFGDYGSMNTNEGARSQVPTPIGDAAAAARQRAAHRRASWFTADVGVRPGERLAPAQQRAGHARPSGMERARAVQRDDRAATSSPVPRARAGSGFRPARTIQLTYTNLFDADGQSAAVQHAERPRRAGAGHSRRQAALGVSGPASAEQDLRQATRYRPARTSRTTRRTTTGTSPRSSPTSGDNPHFLDAVVTTPGGTPTHSHEERIPEPDVRLHQRHRPDHASSPACSAATIQLTDKLRADSAGASSTTTTCRARRTRRRSTWTAIRNTPYNNETFGNGSFRHFNRGITDWAASLGLNYALNGQPLALRVGARGYKMPALDEFLQATAQQQVDLFESREVQSIEGGVKGVVGPFGFTVNGFYTKLKNIVSQGSVVDPGHWRIGVDHSSSPENNSYGAELELARQPASRGCSCWAAAPSCEPSWEPAPARTSGAGSTACRRRSEICRPPTRSAG